MTEDQRETVAVHVHNNPQRVCTVLDGLDETRISHCSQFVSDVTKGKALKGLRIIITSRPCGEAFNLTDGKKHDRRVELIDRRNDVETYIRKILNGREARQLLRKVRNNLQGMSMMTIPLTLQECLAALYVFFTGVMTSRKIVQLVEPIGPDAGHVRTFWMLVSTCLGEMR